ncbi:MAG: RluA family pseudouridine synthase [Erysipelotrichales bacterium]|nr:RluA family pseudouridine synthase [Erysipelotrichales bacterium]
MKEIIITKENEGQRADKFIRKFLNDAPLSFIYKVFRKKDVKVNGHWIKIDYILKSNDVLRIYVTDEQLNEFNNPKPIEKVKFNHEIIYEDENILIVNKPRGLLVHGDSEEKRITLANQVLNYLYSKGEYDPKNSLGFTPAPAHRIDRNTSGLVVFGKTIKALQILLDMFKDKESLEKTYLALVVGKLDKSGIINAPLIKDSKSGLVHVDFQNKFAKTAISEYEVEQYFKDYTLVNIKILTGRTHQIRAHMKYINHPVVGDGKYGDFAVNKIFKNDFNFENQFLHARQIKFINAKEELSYLNGKTFVAKLNDDEARIIKLLK